MADEKTTLTGQISRIPADMAPETSTEVSSEAIAKAEAFIEADEGATNRLMGFWGIASTSIAVAMSLFHLYAAYAIVPTQELRYTHVRLHTGC